MKFNEEKLRKLETSVEAKRAAQFELIGRINDVRARLAREKTTTRRLEEYTKRAPAAEVPDPSGGEWQELRPGEKPRPAPFFRVPAEVPKQRYDAIADLEDELARLVAANAELSAELGSEARLLAKCLDFLRANGIHRSRGEAYLVTI